MKFMKFPTQTKQALNPDQVPSFGYSAMVSCQGGHRGFVEKWKWWVLVMVSGG